jgi:hypothetical protein
VSSAAGSFQRVLGNVNHREIVAKTPTGTLGENISKARIERNMRYSLQEEDPPPRSMQGNATAQKRSNDQGQRERRHDHGHISW